MGRQSFRSRKSDGTIDDGTGGGGATLGVMPLLPDSGELGLITANNVQTTEYHRMGFGSTPGVQRTSGISSGNLEYSRPMLWPITWPSSDGYVNNIKFRKYSSESTSNANWQIAFYESDANGWPELRKGSVFTCTPGSTGSEFLTFTADIGAGIGPFERGETVWVMHLTPASVYSNTGFNSHRFYGQTSNQYSVESPASGVGFGQNPGYSYGPTLYLYVNSGTVSAAPSQISDETTWTITNGSPSQWYLNVAQLNLSSSVYFPFMQISARPTS